MVLAFGWTAARVHYANGGNWTALFCIGADLPMPPELDAGSYHVPGTGYDGQFYRLLAHDPFLQKGYARYVDAPQFRFRRALVPLAAWILALGQARWIDGAFLVVELAFLALGTYWCARLAVRRGRSPWWGLLFAVLPATLASLDRMLADEALAALFAGFLLYTEEQRWRRVWVVAMLAALAREYGILLAAALVIDAAYRRDWRAAARFATSLIPAIGWWVFLHARLKPDSPIYLFQAPVWGLVRRLFYLRSYPVPGTQLILRITDFLAVLGLILCIVLAAFWLRRRPFGPVAVCVALFVLLALCLTTDDYLYEPIGFGRVASPIFLWILLEAIGGKKWLALAPPLAVSLGVSTIFARPMIEIAKGLTGR